MSAYGAAARAPADPPPGLEGQWPVTAAPDGSAFPNGRSYYAPPARLRTQIGTEWPMVGAFHPAYANPWYYSYGAQTPSTVWPVVGETFPAPGLDPNTLAAVTGEGPVDVPGGFGG